FVQRRAIHELAKRGDSAVPALRQVLDAGPRWRDVRNKDVWSEDYKRMEAARQSEWPNGCAKRQKALSALTRINTNKAREATRSGLKDLDTKVRCVALASASLWKDRKALESRVDDTYMFIVPEEERLYYEISGRTDASDARLYQHVSLMIDDSLLHPNRS